MALIGNRSVLFKSPGRWLNGNSAAGGAIAVMRSNFSRHGDIRNSYQAFDPKSAVPYGHLSPSAWVLAKTAGGMSSRNVINGDSNLGGSGSLGLPASASLIGSGDLTQAALALVVSAVAALSGAGGLTSGVVGKLEAAASLAGSGNLAGAAGALASLLASIAGSGTLNSTPYATSSASANIKGYGELTPEGLRDTLWNAIATNYTDAGSMGSKLNNAASGGVDYAALGAAVWANVTRTLTEGGSAPTTTEISNAIRANLEVELDKIIATPTAVENANAVWSHSFTSKLLTIAKFLGLK